MIVSFPTDGSTASGYLAIPEAGTGPGLLVLQEWWGLVDHIRDVCDRFAAEGFVALAPDLYHGKQATSPDQAGKLFMALNIAQAGRELRGAADYLLGHPAVEPKRVGVVGFCMGGQLALYAAQEQGDRLACAVNFYGIQPRVEIDPARVRIPVQGHFGRQDKSVPIERATALARAVQSAGGSFELHEYEAGHAFFNDTRTQVYDPVAAEQAWQRTVGFLKNHLAV
ncbi:MAG TPA: dienelactone hydrolase family protein [Gemmatimonadales bacterium]|jgi:carboxymethylenebutenolidase